MNRNTSNAFDKYDSVLEISVIERKNINNVDSKADVPLSRDGKFSRQFDSASVDKLVKSSTSIFGKKSFGSFFCVCGNSYEIERIIQKNKVTTPIFSLFYDTFLSFQLNYYSYYQHS